MKQGAVTSSRLWAFSPDHGADVVSSHCTLGINQSCYGVRHQVCVYVCVGVLLSLDREEPVAAASYEVLKEGTTSLSQSFFFFFPHTSVYFLSVPVRGRG